MMPNSALTAALQPEEDLERQNVHHHGSHNGSQNRSHSHNGIAADESTPLLFSNATDAATSKPPAGSTDSASHTDTDSDVEIVILTPELSTTKLVITLGTTYVGVFLGAIDASIIATLSGPISSEFQSLSLLSWLATAYLIANAACQPLSGRMTDIFGRGPGLVFSNVMFAAGNLICGLAQNEGTVILGRVIAGIGGGGLMSISTFLASDLVPLRRRGVVQGIGNIAYGSGAMLGGVFGGMLNDATSMGWRLAFLILVPVSLVSAVLVAYLVRVPPKVSNKSLISRIDFTGSFLSVSFVVLLLVGLNSGGNMVPWSHPLVLTTIPVSLATLVLFIWWETKAVQPIIPVRLLLDRTVFNACITNFACTTVVMMVMFYVPLYLQVLGHSATEAGLRILASPLGVSFASVGCGYIAKHTGKYLYLAIFIVATFAGAVALLTTLTETSPDWITFVAMAMHGAGYGGMLTLTLLACMAAVDHEHQAVVTSATYAFRSIGGTLGIAMASSVYQNILKAQLWERFGDLPGAAEEIRRIRDDLGELKRLPEDWRDGVIASFMEAFRGVWFLALGMAIVALISVSLMKQHKLHTNLARLDEEEEETTEEGQQ